MGGSWEILQKVRFAELKIFLSSVADEPLNLTTTRLMSMQRKIIVPSKKRATDLPWTTKNLAWTSPGLGRGHRH